MVVYGLSEPRLIGAWLQLLQLVVIFSQLNFRTKIFCLLLKPFSPFHVVVSFPMFTIPLSTSIISCVTE